MRKSLLSWPSPLANCWMLWRHCCCRYGFYPLAVAPIVTAAFLLSAYSSSGCQFIEVDVGFTPNNAAWTESQVHLGLFFQYRPDLPTAALDYSYRDYFHPPHCQPYTATFQDDFVHRDRTWKVARIMALVAGVGGLVATVVSWSTVVAPVPPDCFWSGLLLPAVMVAFIAEGSKFLFFDVAICRSALWYPTGVDSSPAVAASCTLGWSALVGTVAATIQLVALLLVCLRSPERRELDPDFGVRYRTGAEMDLEEPVSQSSMDGPYSSLASTTMHRSRSHCSIHSRNGRHHRRYVSDTTTEEIYFEDPSLGEEDLYTTSDANESDRSRSLSDKSSALPVKITTTTNNNNNTTTSMTTATSPPTLPAALSSSSSGTDDPVVSKSRLNAMSRMEQRATETNRDGDLLLRRLVSDLDSSFQKSSAGNSRRGV